MGTGREESADVVRKVPRQDVEGGGVQLDSRHVLRTLVQRDHHVDAAPDADHQHSRRRSTPGRERHLGAACLGIVEEWESIQLSGIFEEQGRRGSILGVGAGRNTFHLRPCEFSTHEWEAFH